MKPLSTYKTLSSASQETLYKEKGSKFFAYSFPISTEQEVKEMLLCIKKQHTSAKHYCYAWKIGVEQIQYSVNDSGEPKNSAGRPIYGQIISADLTDVLVVVVRYFGGVKLGVGGLIRAYKTAAQISLADSDIVQKTIKERLKLTFEYQYMNKVMRIVKQKKLEILDHQKNSKCTLILLVDKTEIGELKNTFKKMFFLRLNSK